MANPKISVAALDFDYIKTSFRDYLKSQSYFTDYDLEGSGLSILLDFLALNTHYNAIYMQMIANEMFLDSANMRSSTVSLAKHLGYTPRSITSAKAIISIQINPNDSATNAIIPKNTQFYTSVDGVTYYFVTDKTYTTSLSNNGLFLFNNITLIEGLAYTYRITVDATISNQKFILANPNTDTSTLSVRVQNSITDTTLVTYQLADDLLQLKSDTTAYFLQEGTDGKFELSFGDGIIGKKLVDGNIIIADYILSKGTLVNGATIFQPSSPLAGYPLNLTTINTITNAAGGLDPETIDEIKFSAPKNYQSQQRAVTLSDYIFLVNQSYTNADSVTAWGGEIMNPPQYGKVFISIKPVSGFVLTESTKTLILDNLIRAKNVVSIIPEFVDPDYTFIVINSTVKYNPNNTFKTDGQINSGAYNAILSYSLINLDKFDKEFRYSKLLTAIDDSDPSITNNLTTILLKKVFTPQLEVVASYSLQFNNAIQPGTLSSSTFITVHDTKLLISYQAGNTYNFLDDSLGNILLMQNSIGLPSQSVRKCGTINYLTGLINITEFIPYRADVNGQISITVSPQENDVIPVQNNILYIQPSDIHVNVLVN